MAVKKIPEGHNSVSPYLIVDGAERALQFYREAFGAPELFRHKAPDGKIDRDAPRLRRGRRRRRRSLVAAGGKAKQPVTNQFYGDRAGTFVDPFGYTWHISTHVEDVPPEELDRRAKKATLS